MYPQNVQIAMSEMVFGYTTTGTGASKKLTVY
jgi:hypothetical protein